MSRQTVLYLIQTFLESFILNQNSSLVHINDIICLANKKMVKINTCRKTSVLSIQFVFKISIEPFEKYFDVKENSCLQIFN